MVVGIVVAYSGSVKIPCSPAMQRFNDLVERADGMLDGKGDRLDLRELIDVLASRNFWSPEYGRLAFELEAAAVLVGYFETDKQTTERTR